jgi:hypothetical protein
MGAWKRGHVSRLARSPSSLQRSAIFFRPSVLGGHGSILIYGGTASGDPTGVDRSELSASGIVRFDDETHGPQKVSALRNADDERPRPETGGLWTGRNCALGPLGTT